MSMTPQIAGFVRVDQRGLHLPDGYTDLDGGMVVRTPCVTVDAKTFMVDPDGVFPFVKPDRWDIDPDDDDIRNPQAIPNRVGLKKYGAPIEWYNVHFPDGDGDG